MTTISLDAAVDDDTGHGRAGVIYIVRVRAAQEGADLVAPAWPLARAQQRGDETPLAQKSTRPRHS